MSSKSVRRAVGTVMALIVMAGITSCVGRGSKVVQIKSTNSKVVMTAGCLKRVIDLDSQGKSSVFVGGRLVGQQAGSTVTFSVSLASPNEEPQGIEIGNEEAVESSNSDNNNSDILNVVEGNASVVQKVQFPVSYAPAQVASLLGRPKAGEATRTLDGGWEVTVEQQVEGDEKLNGLKVLEHYQLYAGYDVIRKTVTVRNESKSWLKINQLLTDCLQPDTATVRRNVPLTPGHHGVVPSVIGFGNEDLSRGIISVNEVPSGLRYMDSELKTGYNPQLFEWVVGPGEAFEAEPVWLYGYEGKSYETLPGVYSTAMDRCVEGDYAKFMRTYVIRPSLEAAELMPVFCTWTNYNSNLTQENMQRAIDRAGYMGFRCFQFDAGWCDNDGQQGWACVTTRFDSVRFSDYNALLTQIKTNEMKLGVWYSVFRSMRSMDMTSPESGFSYPLIIRGGGAGMSFASNWKNTYADEVAYIYNRYGARYMKQDLSNTVYGDIARGHESRTYKESLLRGLRGLLESQYLIHQRVPDMALQLSHEIYWKTAGPPADVAVLKYADMYHATPNEYWGAGDRTQQVSDSWPYSPDSLRLMLRKGALRARENWYSHRGLPLYKIEIFGAAMTNFKNNLDAQTLDRQICSWLMGAPTSFSGDLDSLTPEQVEQYRTRFLMLRDLQRKYDIFHNFQYSGVPAPSDDNWHWWGKLNEQGEGAVVVMRGDKQPGEQRIVIPWVPEDGEYEVNGWLTGRSYGRFSGKQLRKAGFSMTLDWGQDILVLTRAGRD